MKCILIALDETGDWLASLTARTGRIYTQYVFTPDEVTHCCEVTPSYYLVPVRYQTEHEVETIEGRTFEEVLAEAGGMYVHCLKIDSLPANMKVEEEFDDIDEAVEYWQSNHHEFNFPTQGVTK